MVTGKLKLLLEETPSALSKLRLSAHQLRTETGRYASNRLDRALRLCTLCDKSDLVDEYHFVLVCPVYDTLRKNTFVRFITKDRMSLNSQL